MDKVFFISDVHLGAHPPAVESRKASKLYSFLTSIQGQADYLYIVGDLYDFWFEYCRAIPKINLKIIAALSQLVESGTVVRYFIGNHDLWHDTYFERELGVEILHEPLAVEHNGLKLFIAHGDGLAPGERKLRFMKWIMKNRFNIFLYRLLHPDLGIPLAHYFSKESKKKGANSFLEQYRTFALGKLEDGFDAVIFGHTHEPMFEWIGKKYYINLGDWINHFSYGEMTEAKLALKTWNEEPA